MSLSRASSAAPSLSRTASSVHQEDRSHSNLTDITGYSAGHTQPHSHETMVAPTSAAHMLISVPAKYSILRAATEYITRPAKVINPDTVHEQQLQRSYIIAGVSRNMYRKVISRMPLLDLLVAHAQAPTSSALYDATCTLRQLVAQEFTRLKNGEIVNLRDESDSLTPAVAAAAAASATSSPEAVRSLLLNPLSHIMVSYLIEEQRFDEAINMARSLYVTRASQNRGAVILRLVQYSDLLRKVAFMVDRQTTLRTHSTLSSSYQEMLRQAVSYLEEATMIREQLAATADREFSLYAQQQQQQLRQQQESAATTTQRRQPPLLTAGTSARQTQQRPGVRLQMREQLAALARASLAFRVVNVCPTPRLGHASVQSTNQFDEARQIPRTQQRRIGDIQSSVFS